MLQSIRLVGRLLPFCLAVSLFACSDPQVTDLIPPEEEFDPGAPTSGGSGSGSGNQGRADAGVADDGGSQDPCAAVSCEEWQECRFGNCHVRDGRCATSDDCASNETCDPANHECVAQGDPCDGVACSSHGTCTAVAGAAVCNCEHGYKPQGAECVADPSAPGWCGIQWVGADNGDIGVDVGYTGNETKVYSQVWIQGQTGSGNPQLAGVKAQLGVTSAPVGYPVVPGNFTWVDAQFNSSCTTCASNHEYIADFPTSAAGSFNFIARFSTNGGESWFYCDKSPGFIISATNLPGRAVIGGGGPSCGGAVCAEWQQCQQDSCVVAPGRCETSSQCNGASCDLSTHLCSGAVTGPSLRLVAQPTLTSNGYSFQVQYTGTSALDLANSAITLNGQAVDLSGVYDQEVFSVSATGLARGKYTYLFRVKDETGARAEALYVPIWVEPTHFEWKDAFLYQIMTDRFFDSDNQRQSAGVPELAKDWQGGDFAGITAKIRDGYFDDMGVNALWISSPILNTDGSGLGTDNTRYSGYHSYWPIATGWTDTNHLPGISSPIETHFGTEAQLRELVQEAHSRGIRVVVDFVANHVFGITNSADANGTQSPLWTQHRNDGWFYSPNSPYICGWDQPINCWFRNYLPDLDYDNAAVMNSVMAHAIWLVQEYDFDGFRLDAVKHMVMKFTTTIRSQVKSKIETTGIPFYMVGETFDGDPVKLAAYVGADKLDGQFDFGFYFNLKGNVLGTGSLQNVKNFCDWNDNFYKQRWSGALMSNFLSNHDVERALRSANGNYSRLRMAQTVLMTSPAIPLVYQGDDIGMDGGGDPDNRRMMRFTGLSAEESNTLSHVRRLGKFRAQHPAARTGTRATCGVGDKHWVYTMTLGNDVVIAGINNGTTPATVTCSGLSGTFGFVDGLSASGSTVQITNGSVTVPAGSSVVLARQ